MAKSLIDKYKRLESYYKIKIIQLFFIELIIAICK